MAGRGARGGMARGRTKHQSSPVPVPDPDVVDGLLKEAIAAEPGQFDDCKPNDAPTSTQSHSTSDAPQSHDEDSETSLTSSTTSGGLVAASGENAEPSSASAAESGMVSEVSALKAKLRGGVQLKGTLNPEVEPFVPNSAKLNPTAAPLNPTAAPFTPSTAASPSVNTASPEFAPTSTKHVPTSSSSALNPNSPTFVPSTSLNAQALEFVPGARLTNGDPNLTGSDQSGEDPVAQQQDDTPYLTVEDIIEGFDVRAKVKSDAKQALLLLRESADMLLRVSVIPESFAHYELKLADTLKAYSPSEEAFGDVGAMLVHWGVAQPGLRYSASKIFHLLFEVDKEGGDLRKSLLTVLHQSFKKQKEVVAKTEQQKATQFNFAYFVGDLYSRLRVRGGPPIRVLGIAIYDLLDDMLKLRDEKAITGVCNVLKLTGSLLESYHKAEGRMEHIIVTLQSRLGDERITLSRSCVSLISRVRDLHERKWGLLPSPVSTIPPGPFPPSLDELPFDMADPFPDFDPLTMEQPPVKSRDEWADYLDDDQQLIGVQEDYPDYPNDDKEGLMQEEGIDPDIEHEFEAFILEMEEHLMMQQQGPPEDEEGQH